uniref:Glutathione reductase n=1 Tax=Hirondellea gigas TaxID=1518452 RepID=A0A6A7G2W1_9CRUS
MILRSVRASRFLSSKLRLFALFRSFSVMADGKENHFDFIVIGGGSGGMACSRRAAQHGARVILFENKRLGGTCVNVGCVPKKVMWNTADISEIVNHIAADYGFSFSKPSFDFNHIRKRRDAYIERLNGIYARNLDNSGIKFVMEKATFVSRNEVEAGGVRYSADHILIATGGTPTGVPVKGGEFTINSDGFFNDMDKLPAKAAVVGAGYIAVELAGVLNSLGSDVTLITRKEYALRRFDELIYTTLEAEMTSAGVHMQHNSSVSGIEKDGSGLMNLTMEDGTVLSGFDTVIYAIGRYPISKDLNLKITGVETDRKGYITSNAKEETNVPGIYSLGDISGKIQLTPVAIAAGRALADRIFGKMEDRIMDYTHVPTVVFSHPTIGSIGLTQKEATEKYGANDLKIYQSTFTNMWYAVTERKSKTAYKLICQGPNEKVVGMHLIGMASDEIMQGFGVAIKMGATKKDFDSCVAIHPTASEELVTMV